MARKTQALGSAERLCRILEKRTSHVLEAYAELYDKEIKVYDHTTNEVAFDFIGDSWGEVYWTIQHAIEVLRFVGITE